MVCVCVSTYGVCMMCVYGVYWCVGMGVWGLEVYVWVWVLGAGEGTPYLIHTTHPHVDICDH